MEAGKKGSESPRSSKIQKQAKMNEKGEEKSPWNRPNFQVFAGDKLRRRA